MLRVGTSGWQYRHWRPQFYPPGVPTSRWLEYFAARFATVEVNNTFYRLPAADTFRAWAECLPADFVMAIKASNYLTHRRRLRDPREPVERLLQHAAPLGAHLGVVLLQLPPDMEAAPDRLAETLRCFAGRVRIAVEPRHDSWWTDDVRAVLADHQAALCLADRGSKLVTPDWRTTDWCYVRLHFGRAQPPSCYGRTALRSWAGRIRALYGSDADGYVYFNNDGNGCALRNASAFARAVERAGCEATRVP
jgi:uncharacterized protein YecE (DUF72 family)